MLHSFGGRNYIYNPTISCHQQVIIKANVEVSWSKSNLKYLDKGHIDTRSDVKSLDVGHPLNKVLPNAIVQKAQNDEQMVTLSKAFYNKLLKLNGII